MSTQEKKQEADFTADVDALLPQARDLAQAGNLKEALDRIAALEKKARNAADLLSTTRLLLSSVLLVRLFPSPQQTDIELLSETIHSLSKKHGQLKQAITRMVQLAMSFLNPPVDPSEAAAAASLPKDDVKMEEDEAGKKGKDAKEVDAGKKTGKKSTLAEVLDPNENREGQLAEAVVTLLDEGKRIGDTGITPESRLKLIETLRSVTEGKIFVEVERARVTLMYSQILVSQGKVSEAADALSDLAVETFGSMERREKVEFILEQMRLNLERSDFNRTNVLSRKINTKFFEDEKQHDLKLNFYELMIRYALHENKFLDVCKYNREIYATPRVRSDLPRAADVLKNIVVFLVLSPYDNEQSDLMARVELTDGLERVAEYKNLLKCFTTPELMRWPGIEELYGPTLRATTVFSQGDAEGDKRWEELHKRVVEHNIRVISKYYTKITLPRLSQLLDLPQAQAEASLAKLVSSGIVYAKIDRPAGIVNFERKRTHEDVLNAWSRDMEKLLDLVERTNHLVAREMSVQRAGLVPGAPAAAVAAPAAAAGTTS
ncbi:proteasome regulatory particle subunit [Tilletia horrida]|uniref:Proteasome regulatory particle subunit n=1 Tax=Tilletia horrida TaxID=155126 RepID=A0AAN6JQL1_9BASI|nr:proteasome regulatory particle subunit [Tilletia horrida]KAK0529836.1 proteasome regulatory particle subunit [Tilletia horrida]